MWTKPIAISASLEPLTTVTNARWWRSYLVATIGPALLTLLSIGSSPTGTGPFDARTGGQFVGIQLAMPAWESIFEPILAIFYIVADAPDYISTAISLMSWVFALCLIAHLLLHRSNSFGGASRAWRGIKFATGACSLLLLYFFFTVLVPLPGWTLKTDDPSLIVADLHSHTTGSHDAFVSPLESADLHHARGYNVFAWTDHYSSRWSYSAQQQVASKTSDAIIGVEISVKLNDQRYYLVLLGIKPSFPIDAWLDGLLDHLSLRRFIEEVHSRHGAVIAVNLHLRESDVSALADDGIDAFEVANFGHPQIDKGVGAALLSAEKANHVALVADSDWHGWSGFFRTWNVIVGHGPQSRAIQVVDALRLRKTDEITPVVSRMFENPSTWKRIFSPLTETVRYAQQLSPLRALSWWAWAIGLCCLAHRLKGSNYNLSAALVASTELILGAAISLRGVQLMAVGLFSATYPYPFLLGGLALTSGVAALIVAWKYLGATTPAPMLA